jgi:tRNA-splicing ligase RtcB
MIEVKKVSEFEYEIPVDKGMNVPGVVFASDNLMKQIKQDNMTLQQVKNVAMLPGILKASIAMPDAHQGYGFCIGGVAAFDTDRGVISPGGVGYDINCSVRLLRTNLRLKDLERKGKKEIVHSLFRTVPSGVGRGSRIKLTKADLDGILRKGTQWAVENGYGVKEDYLHTEEHGCIKGAEPSNVSERAKARGMQQLGSLGSGNHFLEIQLVKDVLDKNIAKEFGLEKGQVVIMIHCGSRGLGHQVASDYIRMMEKEYGFPEQDRELVNAPIKSELGKKYLSAMAAAANFAFANKQLITHWVRENLKHYFPDIKIEVVYDICHNIAKFEEHVVDGKRKEVLVMRKGATRSFGAGREEIPPAYRSVGQPVFIPGSMGTPSYVLSGTKRAEEISFGSAPHGAGRVESRTKARKITKPEILKKELAAKGIDLEAGSFSGMLEEAPHAYKDIEEVVRVCRETGLANPVASLMPVGVVIG